MTKDKAITAIKQARSAPYVASPRVQDTEAHYKGVIEGVQKLFNDKRAQPAPVQDLPFGVGGGLVAIKTLLSRDPCVHANTAIEMIDAILKEHSAAQRQWVSLTADERYDIRASFRGRFLETSEFAEQVQLATEAKLKEKNDL